MVDFRPASQKTNRVSGLITPIDRKLVTRPVSEYNLIEAPTATWSNIPSAGQWTHGAYPAPAFAHPVVVSTSGIGVSVLSSVCAPELIPNT
jgi:hypothetical protein